MARFRIMTHLYCNHYKHKLENTIWTLLLMETSLADNRILPNCNTETSIFCKVPLKYCQKCYTVKPGFWILGLRKLQ